MGYTANDIRNICLLGHGGDGKSALCESMLFTTKAITRLGKRADGTTVSKEMTVRHVYSEMAFYPFTLPITTGPGSISVAVALGATPMHGVAGVAGCLGGIVLNCLVIWFCYSNSDRVTRMLGAVGANALTRIFAFILICIGVSVFWTGFSGLWSSMPH